MSSDTCATVYLALGANLGDRQGQLDEALHRLRRHGVEVMAVSGFIETEPVGGPPGQGSYLNGVACVRTLLSPAELLRLLLQVEASLGRIRQPGERDGPRTLDLDILFYDDRIVQEEGLCIPHPRLHLRRFVLEPLVQIAPQLRHPVLQRTVSELLAVLEARGA